MNVCHVRIPYWDYNWRENFYITLLFSKIPTKEQVLEKLNRNIEIANDPDRKNVWKGCIQSLEKLDQWPNTDDWSNPRVDFKRYVAVIETDVGKENDTIEFNKMSVEEI